MDKNVVIVTKQNNTGSVNSKLYLLICSNNKKSLGKLVFPLKTSSDYYR